MADSAKISPDRIRSNFAAALSDMYQNEVPQYGALLELVADINTKVARGENGGSEPYMTENRIEVERHGAIRLGTPTELSTMRRLLAVMGMEPVGYYDLTVAGLPVHATGFRPISPSSLQKNPFRLFTSLLRLDLIPDDALRKQAGEILAARQIFTSRCLQLIEQHERHGYLGFIAAQEFVQECLHTFRWHEAATVDMATYKALEKSHPLVADVVCFKGPHINHLTPRVLDIEAAQDEMIRRGLNAKEVIEGPPARNHLILLRQTSFLALEEEIAFSNGSEKGGKHRARFGEIEQRGMALTPKGRLLYDTLLQQSRRQPSDQAAKGPQGNLAQAFAAFPDDLDTLRREKLAYFRYSVGDEDIPYPTHKVDIESLLSAGVISFEPITYEDFLPASAAGIFNSNLRTTQQLDQEVSSDQARFESDLGRGIHDPFGLYAELQEDSIKVCSRKLDIALENFQAWRD